MSPFPTSFAHSFVLVGKNNPAIVHRAREAVERAFPSASLSLADSQEQARGLAGESPGAMLLLVAPSATELTAAMEARDEVELPRWAVVVLAPGEIAMPD